MINTGILFDLDGTLWEVVDSTYTNINIIAKKYGVEVSRDVVYQSFGKNKFEIAKNYFPTFSEEKALSILEEANNENLKRLKENGGYIYPGLEEVLFELKQKYSLYIVSNAVNKEYIEAFLISSKLWKYFNDYIAASELLISKGEAISKIIEDYELTNTIYVGDTINDYEAAQLANVEFVQCLYGFDKDLKCKYKIKDISELPTVIEKITKNQND